MHEVAYYSIQITAFLLFILVGLYSLWYYSAAIAYILRKQIEPKYLGRCIHIENLLLTEFRGNYKSLIVTNYTRVDRNINTAHCLSTRVPQTDTMSAVDDTYPLVSILIPMFNEETVIERTIERTMHLDYPNYEIILIDDASTDATGTLADLADHYYSKIKVVHRRQEDKISGKPDALNEGLKIAKGQYVLVFDADNYPEPNALKVLVAEFRKDPSIACVQGNIQTINKNETVISKLAAIDFYVFHRMLYSPRAILGTSYAGGTIQCVRRDILDEVDGWNPEALVEDFDISLRVMKRGYRLAHSLEATTWEEEPETLRALLRQRRRWAQGFWQCLFWHYDSIFKVRGILRTLELCYSIFYVAYNTLVLPIAYLFIILWAFDVIELGFGMGNIIIYSLLAMLFSVLFISIEAVFDARDYSLLPYTPLVLLYCNMSPVVGLAGLYDFLRGRRGWRKTIRSGATSISR